MLRTVLSFLRRPASQSRQLSANGSMPGTSLLLNVQRKKLFPKRRIWSISSHLHVYLRIGKKSSQTHDPPVLRCWHRLSLSLSLSLSTRFTTKTLWVETLMNTSTSKLRHLENGKSNCLTLTSLTSLLEEVSHDEAKIVAPSWETSASGELFCNLSAPWNYPESPSAC